MELNAALEADFRAQATAQGFPEPMPAPRAALLNNDTHTHDFTAFIIVLDGEFTVTTDAGATTYGPGETFTIVAGTPHAERAGSAGANLLIARR